MNKIADILGKKGLVCVRSRSTRVAALAILTLLAAQSIARAGLRTTPVWESVGTQTSGLYGQGGRSVGDVNGDGYDDVVVGSVYESNGEVNEGKIYLFLGSATGPETTPAWTAESNLQYGRLGYCAMGVDVNGDGYSDIVAGAYGYSRDVANISTEGRAFVWYGGPPSPGNRSGLGADGTPENADWSLWSTISSEGFGSTCEPAGDVNGDGYQDVMITAAVFGGSQPGEGRVYVFYGGPSGLSANPVWSAESNQSSGFLGDGTTRGAAAGDVNHDGYSDLILGCYGCEDVPDPNRSDGRVYVYLGSPTGLGPNGTPANADWVAQPSQANARFGGGVASADLNGDGYVDVIVGASLYDNDQTDEGAIFVWIGGTSGAGNPTGLGANGTPANAAWLAESNQASASLTRPVAGDFNHDGFADIATAAGGYDGALVNEGATFVWLGGAPSGGNPTGLGANGDPLNADETIFGTEASNFAGAPLSTGDFNGDGFDDLLTTGPGYDVGPLVDAGKAEVFLGTCGSVDADGDGVAPTGSAGCVLTDPTDCNDADGRAWATPGEVNGLLVASNKSDLTWSPVSVGGTAAGMLYDTLRSQIPSDFISNTTCLESNDGPNTTTTDTAVPGAGGAFFYLVRAENSCPAGEGLLGKRSNGSPISGRNCP